MGAVCVSDERLLFGTCGVFWNENRDVGIRAYRRGGTAFAQQGADGGVPQRCRDGFDGGRFGVAGLFFLVFGA